MGLTTAAFTLFALPVGNGIGTQILVKIFHASPKLAAIRTVDEAIVIGAALSLSSSAFVLQIMAEKGELATKFGSATLGILLLQVSIYAELPLLSVNGSPHTLSCSMYMRYKGKPLESLCLQTEIQCVSSSYRNTEASRCCFSPAHVMASMKSQSPCCELSFFFAGHCHCAIPSPLACGGVSRNGRLHVNNGAPHFPGTHSSQNPRRAGTPSVGRQICTQKDL